MGHCALKDFWDTEVTPRPMLYNGIMVCCHVQSICSSCQEYGLSLDQEGGVHSAADVLP